MYRALPDMDGVYRRIEINERLSSLIVQDNFLQTHLSTILQEQRRHLERQGTKKLHNYALLALGITWQYDHSFYGPIHAYKESSEAPFPILHATLGFSPSKGKEYNATFSLEIPSHALMPELAILHAIPYRKFLDAIKFGEDRSDMAVAEVKSVNSEQVDAVLEKLASEKSEHDWSEHQK